MAEYPGSETERRISADALHAVVGAIFEPCGMSSEDATLRAETLVVADLRGVHSHGVLRVPDYVHTEPDHVGGGEAAGGRRRAHAAMSRRVTFRPS
jgi:LDH2 family malate/lactate/ureidoglycolate dehydrogenase